MFSLHIVAFSAATCSAVWAISSIDIPVCFAFAAAVDNVFSGLANPLVEKLWVAFVVVVLISTFWRHCVSDLRMMKMRFSLFFLIYQKKVDE